jgi:hypothetical protein
MLSAFIALETVQYPLLPLSTCFGDELKGSSAPELEVAARASTHLGRAIQITGGIEGQSGNGPLAVLAAVELRIRRSA